MPRFKHEAWNVLFDNFPVPKILGLFQEFYEIFGEDVKRSRAQLRRNKEWIQTKESRARKESAWKILFSGMNLEAIVSEINRVWIDPDYELVVTYDSVQRVTMGIK